ncbi:MAG: hypothetical protein DF280_02625 ['Brassica napus' phytoplasma]|nr:MAG: hypothetical protein DF280_02625 ['Brassica napus' phytoplasma]
MLFFLTNILKPYMYNNINIPQTRAYTPKFCDFIFTNSGIFIFYNKKNQTKGEKNEKRNKSRNH